MYICMYICRGIGICICVYTRGMASAHTNTTDMNQHQTKATHHDFELSNFAIRKDKICTSKLICDGVPTTWFST